MQEISIQDTQLLLDSDSTLKHKVVYIAAYLIYKHGEVEMDTLSIECSKFLQELDREGVRVPSLATTYFVQAAVHLLEVLHRPKNGCKS